VQPEPGSEIYLLGYDSPLSWTYDASDGLVITLPEDLQTEAARPGRYAYSFKIRGGPVDGDGGA